MWLLPQRWDFPTLFRRYVGACKSPEIVFQVTKPTACSILLCGCSDKIDHTMFNPRLGWGLNPGPPGWHTEILPTALTLHTQILFNIFSVFPLRRSTLVTFHLQKIHRCVAVTSIGIWSYQA